MALLVGCATDRGGPASLSLSPDKAVEQLHLLVTSVTLNLDKVPGPDGFGVRVYASNRLRPEAIPITSGTLETLMFDGIVKASDTAVAKPLRIWSHSAGELKTALQKTSIGASYRFILSWGEARPTQHHMTVLARYTAPDGRQLLSAPSTIVVTLK